MAQARSMRAAVYRGRGDLRIEERPVPAPGPDEVLVEVSHCGVCGTDLHFVLEGMGAPDSVGGHEWSGRVIALGRGVDAWSKGDRVVGTGPRGCGACAACEARRPSLCERRPALGGDFEGAFAQFVRCRANELVRVPEGLELRSAALAEPLAVALHALSRAGAHAGQRALVSGTGPLGLLVIAALRAYGVDDVTGCEPVAVRRERAGRAGATRLLEPEALEIPAMPFDVIEAPYDIALECSGNPRAMETALGQLARGGTLVLVGTGMRRPKLDHNRVLLNELVVTGAFNYDADGFEAALALLASGALPVDVLIERDDVALDGLLDAIQQLGEGALAGKVMARPGDRGGGAS